MPPVSGIKPAPPSAQKVKSGMHTRNRVVSDHFCTLLAFRPSITAPGPLPVLGFDVSICTPQSGPRFAVGIGERCRSHVTGRH